MDMRINLFLLLKPNLEARKANLMLGLQILGKHCEGKFQIAFIGTTLGKDEGTIAQISTALFKSNAILSNLLLLLLRLTHGEDVINCLDWLVTIVYDCHSI